MAKSRSRKKDVNPDESSVIHLHLAKVAAAKAVQIMKRGPAVIIAMLYQIADNALKSGRASGNVYMRNGRIRKMVVPALVQNGYTTPVRSLLSMLSSSWNALTQAQRDSWLNSTSFFRSNRFGTSFSLKGKSLYVALNANLINTGNASVTDCPLPEDVPGITDGSAVATSGANTIALTFTPTPTDANVNHLVYMTANLSAGVDRPQASAFRLVGVIPPTTASPFASGGLFTAKFGVLTSGAKIFIKLVPISATTGQAGAGLVISSIVV